MGKNKGYRALFQDAIMQCQSGAVSMLTDLAHLQWEPRILGQSSLPFFHPPSVMTYVTILPRGQASSVLIFHKLAENGKEVIWLTKELASIAAEILWGFLISPPIMTSSAHHQRRLLICERFSWPQSNSMKNWRWVFICYISNSWQISRGIQYQKVVTVFV